MSSPTRDLQRRLRSRPILIWPSSVNCSMSWMKQKRELILLNLMTTS
ncbi:hypothetical protein cypCar_00048711 [Cyprinus carpio]|nr:hypothetical protein cypCar_00048711 [Cyprinus carpio]